MPGQGEASWVHLPGEEAEGFWDRLLSRLDVRLPTFLQIIFSSQQHSHGKASAGGKLVFTQVLGLAGAQQPPHHQQQHGGTRTALTGQMALQTTLPLKHSKTQPLCKDIPLLPASAK